MHPYKEQTDLEEVPRVEEVVEVVVDQQGGVALRVGGDPRLDDVRGVYIVVCISCIQIYVCINRLVALLCMCVCMYPCSGIHLTAMCVWVYLVAWAVLGVDD